MSQGGLTPPPRPPRPPPPQQEEEEDPTFAGLEPLQISRGVMDRRALDGVDDHVGFASSSSSGVAARLSAAAPQRSAQHRSPGKRRLPLEGATHKEPKSVG